MKVYFASDHAGFALKTELLAYIQGLGNEAEDCGAFSYEKEDDYPQFIAVAAQKLSQDQLSGIDSRAIVIGGSGQGEAMVANRFKGVRCALYYGKAGTQEDMNGQTLDMIASVREHNNANALSLGARFMSVEEAKLAVAEWLSAPFSNEARHARRIAQIDAAL